MDEDENNNLLQACKLLISQQFHHSECNNLSVNWNTLDTFLSKKWKI